VSRSARRQHLLAEPFPEEWPAIIERNVFVYRLLPAPEQAKLRDAMRIMVAEKYWEGCGGLEITDEIRVTIAAQAAVLLLGFTDYYFDQVKTVLVYPGEFDQPNHGGDDDDDTMTLLGKAQARGPVAVSWEEAYQGSRYFTEENVVLHEFAHALGHRFDAYEAVPMPDSREQRKQWREVLRDELRRLRTDVDEGRETVLDPYGAQNITEFFAVATESFFLDAREMRELHPRLYDALASFYNQDPTTWREPTDEELTEIEAEDE
jgi:Mlc titration factor MtfA (ptsG expression regulator)